MLLHPLEMKLKLKTPAPTLEPNNFPVFILSTNRRQLQGDAGESFRSGLYREGVCLTCFCFLLHLSAVHKGFKWVQGDDSVVGKSTELVPHSMEVVSC